MRGYFMKNFGKIALFAGFLGSLVQLQAASNSINVGAGQILNFGTMGAVHHHTATPDRERLVRTEFRDGAPHHYYEALPTGGAFASGFSAGSVAAPAAPTAVSVIFSAALECKDANKYEAQFIAPMTYKKLLEDSDTAAYLSPQRIIKVLKDLGFPLDIRYFLPIPGRETMPALENSIQALIDNGAPLMVRPVDGGEPVSIIAQAASRGLPISVLEVLRRNGADINARSGNYKRTALFEACGCNTPAHEAIIRYLLAHGARAVVNVADGHGWTPLRAAIEYDGKGVIQMLLDAGAEPTESVIAAARIRLGRAISGHYAIAHIVVLQEIMSLLQPAASEPVGDPRGSGAMPAAAPRVYEDEDPS